VHFFTKKFLVGLDDIVIHDTEAQAAFKQHFYDLHDIEINVNILYADLDVLFIREFNWFAMSDYFVCMTLITAASRTQRWDLAFEMCKSWEPNRWAYEQDIYKTMVRLLQILPSK
jgi:hypothetical protein